MTAEVWTETLEQSYTKDIYMLQIIVWRWKRETVASLFMWTTSYSLSTRQPHQTVYITHDSNSRGIRDNHCTIQINTNIRMKINTNVKLHRNIPMKNSHIADSCYKSDEEGNQKNGLWWRMVCVRHRHVDLSGFSLLLFCVYRSTWFVSLTVLYRADCLTLLKQ